MAELVRAEPRVLLRHVEEAPAREQLDRGVLGVLEREQPRDARQRVGLALAGDAFLEQGAGGAREIVVAGDLQAEPRAALDRRLLQDDRELSDARGEAGAPGVAVHDLQADDLPVIFDLPVDIGRLEVCVPEPFHLDHASLPAGLPPR